MEEHIKQIEDRQDISILVKIFYGKIRKNTTLGPIFNTSITHWEDYLELLNDFWEA